MSSISPDYFDQYDDIVDTYLPDRGEGSNAASQAVAAANNIIYGYYNNGDCYDNTYYLEGGYNDISSYANWLYRYLGLRPLLDRIQTAKTEDAYEQILARLAKVVFNETTLQKVLAKYGNDIVGSIYSCDGPYSFSSPDDGDWDDAYPGEYDLEEEDWN